jgi:hypothetical protein
VVGIARQLRALRAVAYIALFPHAIDFISRREEKLMPKKPDYKREKKLREAAQRKRNEEAQQRKASRKSTAENGADNSAANPETP